MSSVLSTLSNSSLTSSSSHSVIRSGKTLVSCSSSISRTHVSGQRRIVGNHTCLSLLHGLPHDVPRDLGLARGLDHASLHLQEGSRHRHSGSLHSQETDTHGAHSRERTDKRLDRPGELGEGVNDACRQGNQALERNHEAAVNGCARVLQGVLEGLDLSCHGTHDDAHGLINERRTLSGLVGFLQLLHVQAEAVRHTRQQFHIAHVLEAKVLNRLRLINLVADACKVLQDTLEHLVRVIAPKLLELLVSRANSTCIGVHRIATLCCSRVNGVENTLQRSSRPFLRNSQRRQRRRQGENLILGKTSTLALRGDADHHVRNLRLSRNRLCAEVRNLVRKDSIAVPGTLG